MAQAFLVASALYSVRWTSFSLPRNAKKKGTIRWFVLVAQIALIRREHGEATRADNLLQHRLRCGDLAA
eukprot:scaffold15472_cov117-Cylindrotheca_fusiformis.AAC.19